MIWPYLKAILREQRVEAALTLRDLEGPTGRDRGHLSRIETGESGKALERLDAIVAGYAEAAGVPPIDLYRQALERWEEAERIGLDPTRGRAAARRQSKL